MVENLTASGGMRTQANEEALEAMNGFLQGIARTLRVRGTLVQRMLCAALMALLTGARLPGGQVTAPLCRGGYHPPVCPRSR